jgi:hypothetical protein
MLGGISQAMEPLANNDLAIRILHIKSLKRNEKD